VFSTGTTLPHILYGYTLNYEPRRLRRG